MVATKIVFRAVWAPHFSGMSPDPANIGCSNHWMESSPVEGVIGCYVCHRGANSLTRWDPRRAIRPL